MPVPMREDPRAEAERPIVDLNPQSALVQVERAKVLRGWKHLLMWSRVLQVRCRRSLGECLS
jgi:hypothetical protein